MEKSMSVTLTRTEGLVEALEFLVDRYSRKLPAGALPVSRSSAATAAIMEVYESEKAKQKAEKAK